MVHANFSLKQFCDHCTYTLDGAECSCGCTAYDEWCGCDECLKNHFPYANKNQNNQSDEEV